MLALLIGLLVSAGLLLRGSWDLWAQTTLFIAVCGGTTAWLIGRILTGYVPLPSNRLLAWAGALAALSGLAAYHGPLSAYSVPSWRVILLGLWVFVAIAVASKDERAAVDQTVRAAAWVLVLLAFYQHYREGALRPASALVNQNVFAGAILMFLPLAVQQRDWFLTAGLLVTLWWAKSVGAWMGLAGALILTRRSRDSFANWTGMSILFVCLVLIYGKLQSPEVLNRWQWWKGAAAMAAAEPLLGFGPGTYAYAVTGYLGADGSLSSLYAHQHFLEVAAECGWVYLALWAGALGYFLRRGSPHKRFGALAVLIQSLWDYALSIPGVFWVFDYFAASTTPQTSRGINIAHRRKPFWAVAVLVVGAGVCFWASRDLRADRLRQAARVEMAAGRPEQSALNLLEKSRRLVSHPETERQTAEVLLSRKPLDEATARAAANHLERSARLNPYRASTWIALERLYAQLGEPVASRRFRREGQRYCPILRGGRQ